LPGTTGAVSLRPPRDAQVAFLAGATTVLPDGDERPAAAAHGSLTDDPGRTVVIARGGQNADQSVVDAGQYVDPDTVEFDGH
jgi:hypothetical protein